MNAPQQGDRIIIKNIPTEYPFKDLYQGGGTINNSFNGTAINDNGNVGFLTGYTPYKDKEFSCSGCGYSIPADKLKYVETKPGTFWKFKNGFKMAGNSEYYQENVNYFEADFKDINK